MTEEMLQAAREAVRNPKPSSAIALDAAALDAARRMPVVVDLTKIVDFLSGASTSGNAANQRFTGAADQSGQYYQGAGQQSNQAYADALNKLISSTGSGSPAAQTFGAEQAAALQPRFDQENAALAARNAAQGIGSSGSGLYNTEMLGADQSAALAGAISPLYANALAQYGGLLGSQAGAQSGIAQAGAGVQSGLVGQGAAGANQTYGQAIQDFYGAASTAATGMPSGNTNPYGKSTPGVYDPSTYSGGSWDSNPYASPQSGGKQ